jgi:hypothetical protein
MSIINTVLSKLKQPLRKQVEAELASATLKEGAQIEAEAFEPGQPVFVVSEDGEKMPLPQGEYELEGGEVLVVNEDGNIEEIRTGGEAEEEEVEAQQPELEKQEEAEEPKEEPTAEVEAEAVEQPQLEEQKEEMGKDEILRYIDQAIDEKMTALKEEIEAGYGKKKDEEKMSAQKKLTKIKPNPEGESQQAVNLSGNYPKGHNAIRNRAARIINNFN